MKNKVIPSHYFTVKEQSLVSMFCQAKRRFVIPYNQRPWSWKEKNIDELWKDILKTTNHFFNTKEIDNLWSERVTPIGSPHFIGAFVFEEKENDFSVVDGQQRITAISMFITALRDNTYLLLNNAKTSKSRGSLENYIDNFRSWLISDFEDDVLISRLKVDDNYQSFFSEYIIECRNLDERKAFLDEFDKELDTEPVLKSFKKSFDHISSIVSDFLKNFPTDDHRFNAIKAIYSTLENCFICISSDVKEESFSYEVFKCLNAKGLPLSEADKLKNELFTQSKISEHDAIKKSWEVISSNTPYSAVSQFIRQRHVALVGDCPDSKLHSTITTTELENKYIPDVVKLWEYDSEIYARVCLHKSVTGKNAYTENELEVLKEIKNLKIGLASILLFAAHKQHFESDRDTFFKLIKLAANFSFRVLTIGKKDTAVLESNLGKAARAVINGDSVKDIRNILKAASPDSDFQSDFENYSTRTTTSQFYILNRIEKYYLNPTPFVTVEHSQLFNIEHILPKNFDDKRDPTGVEWQWARIDKDKHKQYVNRLGNLALLEGEINRDVSSFDYGAKRGGNYPTGYQVKKGGIARQSYNNSLLPSIKRLVNNKTYKSWNFETIELRQKEMAETALNVWNL